jgi:GNAT superfamily N-acetyltransferase
MQAGALRVRRADRDDLGAVLALLSELHEQEPPLQPDDAAAETFERMLASPGRVLLLAEAGGAAVGTLDLLVVENLTRGARPWAVIENFVVDRAHRRMGIGSALLGAAAEIAREAGAFKLQLVSHARREAAHAAYERAGFDAPVRGFRRYLGE